MPRGKKFTAEQVIGKLREAEVGLAQGKTVPEVVRKLGVTEQTYYRWKREYGGLRTDQAKRLKDLEKENARLKRFGICIGLDFEAGKFGKREVRRLRRGVIAFGQDHLPVRIHGIRHVSADDALPAMPPPRRSAVQPVRRQDLDAATPVRTVGGDHNTQGHPACCRGPAVDFGASGGDDTGNFRTDEPISGMVHFRTVSDVGATGFEQQPILSGKPGNVIPGGAECGALPADSAASPPDAGPAGDADPLLVLVIEAWPTLTAEDRLAVVERIATKLCASIAAPRRRADESAPHSGETNFRRRGRRTGPRRT